MSILPCGCVQNGISRHKCEQAYQLADELRKSWEWYDLKRGTDEAEAHNARRRYKTAITAWRLHYGGEQ